MVLGLSTILAVTCGLSLFRNALSEDDVVDVDLSCVDNIPRASLLQQRYQKAEAIMSSDLSDADEKNSQMQVCDGVMAVERCWYMSNAGANCDSTCEQHGRSYSFAKPVEDMTPKLLGHEPVLKQDPWIFLECYDAKEDRYHPYNPNAWGVPEKTPANELPEAGQHSYPSCRLSCPCTLLPIMNESPTTTPPTTASPSLGSAPDLGPTILPVAKCSDGVGVAQQQRCWYLSETGANCDSTCAARGRDYSFSAPAEDVTPKLVGHIPRLRQDPWVFLECYVGKEDRYHPFNSNAWGVPEKTPANELGEAGQHSYPSCRLACPCTDDTVQPTAPPTLGGVMASTTSTTTTTTTTPLVTLCDDGIGVLVQERCWYLSATGANCDSTCAAAQRQYSFAGPSEDVTPKLVGHVPIGKQEPWIFLECYVGKEDRYHPFNPNAWGVPGKTPVEELSEAGQHSYPSCQLACPCALKTTTTTTTTTQPIVLDCSGFSSDGRCWYLSEVGASCGNTCAAYDCNYTFGAPPLGDIMPQLLGRVPLGREDPWQFVECYNPNTDRYYPYNQSAWGVPGKTAVDELPRSSQFAYATCQLACPCTGSCVGTASTTTTTPSSAPLGVSAPVSAPLGVLNCSGLSVEDRCWYLSDVGATCDDTCAIHNCSYSFGVPPVGDSTPQLLGRVPRNRQNPWMFLECYVPEKDRYYPFNRADWNSSSTGSPAKAGQYSHDSCRLSCSCAGSCIGDAPTPTTTTTTTTTSTVSSACSGYWAQGRCWYLSLTGSNCADTCLVHSCNYSFSEPPSGDIAPQLLGIVPKSRQNPWMFLECYDPGADRYYPFNRIDWGSRANYSAEALAQAGQFRHVSCRLSCSCVGNCVGDVPSLPVPISTTSTTTGSVPDITTTTTTSAPLANCSGYWEAGRCWYLSELGASCADTCAINGLAYSWAAPPAGKTITPRLLGKEPALRQNPWAFVECYVPEGDRYHPVSMDAWGIPGKSAYSKVEAALWRNNECRLACPCAAVAPKCRWVQPAACAPEFEYKGLLYSGCPTVDREMPWCQHRRKSEGELVLDDWSKCVKMCDGDVPSETLNCEWTAPDTCMKEYDYEGSRYVGCTSVDHDSPWCSNAHPYNGSWSHCNYACNNPSDVDSRTMATLNQRAASDSQLCTWKPAAACSPKFVYMGTQYEGCAMFVDHPTPWCSHDPNHSGAWSKCELNCTNASS